MLVWFWCCKVRLLVLHFLCPISSREFGSLSYVGENPPFWTHSHSPGRRLLYSLGRLLEGNKWVVGLSLQITKIGSQHLWFLNISRNFFYSYLFNLVLSILGWKRGIHSFFHICFLLLLLFLEAAKVGLSQGGSPSAHAVQVAWFLYNGWH